MLTPGRFILAEPSNATPPIVLVAANLVAVDAFPVTSPTKPPIAVTLPVPDTLPPKKVFPVIPKFSPRYIELLVVFPLSVTSCSVSEAPT